MQSELWITMVDGAITYFCVLLPSVMYLVRAVAFVTHYHLATATDTKEMNRLERIFHGIGILFDENIENTVESTSTLALGSNLHNPSRLKASKLSNKQIRDATKKCLYFVLVYTFVIGVPLMAVFFPNVVLAQVPLILLCFCSLFFMTSLGVILKDCNDTVRFKSELKLGLSTAFITLILYISFGILIKERNNLIQYPQFYTSIGYTGDKDSHV
jgi:hypothetical protein